MGFIWVCNNALQYKPSISKLNKGGTDTDVWSVITRPESVGMVWKLIYKVNPIRGIWIRCQICGCSIGYRDSGIRIPIYPEPMPISENRPRIRIPRMELPSEKCRINYPMRFPRNKKVCWWWVSNSQSTVKLSWWCTAEKTRFFYLFFGFFALNPWRTWR